MLEYCNESCLWVGVGQSKAKAVTREQAAGPHFICNQGGCLVFCGLHGDLVFICTQTKL